MHITVRTLAIVAVLLSCQTAGAALIDQGDTTLDTDTNLEWLDLTLTRDQSYDAVAAGFGGYVTTEGFRFATSSEVQTLYENAGISFFDAVFRPGEVPAHVLVIELLGFTGSSEDSFVTQGFADFDVFDPVTAVTAGVGVNLAVPRDLSSAFEAAAVIQGGLFPTILKSESDALTGAFLVRPAMLPEPGAALLVAAGGAAGLFGRRLRARG
ncbi:MAG: hypothetical protein HKP30_08730 [Myxococcales bacterium]|nr:hypothetical protein [Myxococcales bacterium]